jgi:hypothetical protein
MIDRVKSFPNLAAYKELKLQTAQKDLSGEAREDW